MKKYLLILLSLTCINAFAQQPALDPERQKRLQEIIAKEVEKMPDPIAIAEAENKERIRRQKALEEHKKHMESPEVKRKLAQMQMFENMLKQYNNLDEKAKTAYRENIFTHAFKFFDEQKKSHPNEPGILKPSGDSSKFVLTYEDKSVGDLSQYQLDRLTYSISRMICETPHFLMVLGVDTPIETVIDVNNKVVGKVNMTKKDCRYIDFNVK
jgi:hypothetical protein